jgi:hypothetical protein
LSDLIFECPLARNPARFTTTVCAGVLVFGAHIGAALIVHARGVVDGHVGSWRLTNGTGAVEVASIVNLWGQELTRSAAILRAIFIFVSNLRAR